MLYLILYNFEYIDTIFLFEYNRIERNRIKMKFIGREDELNLLNNLIKSDNFESVLVYGRRRVGKSELIKHLLEINDDVLSIYYESKQTSEQNNLISFTDVISYRLNLPLKFNNIEELLDFIFLQSKNKKIILVIDEYSFLKAKIEGMDSILQNLIDKYANYTKLKLIICGSYIQIMKDLLSIHNPLYGRFKNNIDLLPMNYYDSSKFYSSFSNEDKITLYSVFGGIPYYNSLIDENKTVKENIIDLVASKDSSLYQEIPSFLNSEISRIVNANEVFEVLGKGHHKFTDIASKSHVSSTPSIIDTLNQLINLRLVEKRSPINDENNRKKSNYYICDNLALFYYKYIFVNQSIINVMNKNDFFDYFIKEDFYSKYIPKQFENICKEFLIKENKKGNIKIPFYKIGTYYYDDPRTKTNGEFDIVTLDKNGYIFYECKYKEKKLDEQLINKELEQVKKTNLDCYKYGFFSKNGFVENIDDNIIQYNLDDLYK